MRLTACLYFLLLLLIPHSLASDTHETAAKKKPLNISCFNYPPFIFIDPDTHETTGFLVELEKRIWEPYGYEVNFQLTPLARAIRHVIHGQTDLMCAYVPNVSKDVQLMPLPVGTLIYYAWVPNTDDWQYDGLDSLKKRKLITIHGLNYSGSVPGFSDFLEENPPPIKLSGQDPTAQAIRILASKRADTLIMDEPHMNHYLSKSNLGDKIKTAGVVGTPTFTYIAGAASNPDFDELQTIFLLELIKLRESGELDALRERFGVPDWGIGGHLNGMQQRPRTNVRAPVPAIKNTSN